MGTENDVASLLVDGKFKRMASGHVWADLESFGDEVHRSLYA